MATRARSAQRPDFPSRLSCERLILVGDIVDLWWVKKRRAVWNSAHNRVVAGFRRLALAGTVIQYVPGNHDQPLRGLLGQTLAGVQVRRRLVHTTANGQRLLIVHGDDFDGQVALGSLKERFGDHCYDHMLGLHHAIGRLRKRIGLTRPWSLADFIKRNSATAEAYIDRFVEAAVDAARSRGLDGIVCGHIHRADLRQVDGITYANDGDWVESCTALVEDMRGHLHLLRPLETQQIDCPAALPALRSAA